MGDLKVVQFMHSGVEIPGVGTMVPWNASRHHYRRLIHHKGEYVDKSNRIIKGDLAFWNEYEAPTNANPVTIGNRGWNYAKRVHEIARPIQGLKNVLLKDPECCANTDPCVFGKTFKYSNCQQVPGGDLWNLPAGSLVIFGSWHDNSFYLDTVFVTADDGVSFTVPVASQLPFKASSEFRKVTLDNLVPRPRKRGKTIDEFKLYRGKGPVVCSDWKVENEHPYSFTPARIFSSSTFNERCKLDLAYINQQMKKKVIGGEFSLTLKQHHKAVMSNASPADVLFIWKLIRDAVRNGKNGRSKFELGVHFDW